MEQQKSIEVSVRINLLDLQQVNAYHNLLLAIGGHAVSTPHTEARIYGESGEPFNLESFRMDQYKKGQVNNTQPNTEEAFTLSAEKTEAPKRLRTKKVVEAPTAEAPTAEAPTDEAPTAEASEAPVIETSNTLDVDTFRSKVVLVTMSSSEGMARKDQIKAHLKVQYGEFNAERLTGEQRTEALAWMRDTFTDVNFD